MIHVYLEHFTLYLVCTAQGWPSLYYSEITPAWKPWVISTWKSFLAPQHCCSFGTQRFSCLFQGQLKAFSTIPKHLCPTRAWILSPALRIQTTPECITQSYLISTISKGWTQGIIRGILSPGRSPERPHTASNPATLFKKLINCITQPHAENSTRDPTVRAAAVAGKRMHMSPSFQKQLQLYSLFHFIYFSYTC